MMQLPIVDNSSKIFSDGFARAELINQHFFSVFTVHYSFTCFFNKCTEHFEKALWVTSYCCDHSSQIIGITESWCTSDVGDAELHLQRYCLFRYDWQSGVGDGVLLYISENLATVMWLWQLSMVYKTPVKQWQGIGRGFV